MTPEELKRIKEAEAIEKERLRIERERRGLTASDSYLKDSVEQARELTDFSRQLTEDLKEQVGMRRGIGEENRKLVSLARQLQDSASQVTAEIGIEAAVAKQLTRDRELQRNILNELQSAQSELTNEEAIAAQRISDIAREESKLKAQLNNLQDRSNELIKQANALKASGAKTDQETRKGLIKDNALQQVLIQAKEEELAQIATEREVVNQGLNTATQKVATLQNQADISTDLVGIREAELRTQMRITQAMGVTGAVVTGLGGIMQRLGLRSGIFNQTVEDTAEAMRKVAEETEKAGGKVDKFKTMMVGIKTLINGTEDGIGGLKRALTDPATISVAILDAFLQVDQAATDLQQKIGMNASAFVAQNGALATSVQQMELMSSLADETGRNVAAIFTSQTIGEAAELQNLLGLSAQQAGSIAIMATESGQSVDQVTDNVFGQVDAFNAVNKTAISANAVLKDIGDASFDIKASFLAFPDGITKAAAAAKRLGMNLDDVNNIADQLMDFESSIEAELEAQLLTGKQINMAKARELALNNDLAGLSNEIFKNSVDVAEYGKMNRIQQQALAKSMGITTEQLAKMAYQRGIDAKMTDEQLKASTGLTREEYERMSAQDAMAVAMGKLAQAFAPVLDIVAELANAIAPFIAGIAKIVGFVAGNTMGKLAIGAFVAARAFGGFSNVITASIRGINSLSQGFMNYVKNVKSSQGILKKVGALLGLGSEDKAGELKRDAAGRLRDAKGRFAKDPTKKLTEASKKVPKNTTSGAQGTSSLTSTIQKIDAKKLLAGAAAMAIAAGAVFIFAKATQEFMEVSWSSVGKAVVGLAALVLAVGSIGAIMMSGVGAVAILAGAAAMAVMAGSLYVLGKAMQLFNDVNYEGIGQLGGSFTSLASGVAALALVSPFLLSTAAGLLLLGIATSSFGNTNLTPLAEQLAALGTAGPGLITAGLGLTVLAGGLAALALTTPSLIIASAGLGLLAASSALLQDADFTNISQQLIQLGIAGPGLFTAASGLFAIAGGLTAFSLAMAASTTLGGLTSLFGTGPLTQLEALAAMSAPLSQVGVSLTAISAGLALIGPALMSAPLSQVGVSLTAISAGLALMGPALMSVGAGLAVLSGNMLLAGPALIGLGALALMGPGLALAGDGVVRMAQGVAQLATAISDLEVEKLEELKSFTMTATVAGVAASGVGAIGEMVSSLTGGSEDSENSELLARVDQLIAAVEADRVTKVYMDSNEIDMKIVQGRTGL